MTKQQKSDIERLGWQSPTLAARYAATVRHLDALRRDVNTLRRLRESPFCAEDISVSVATWKRIAKREGWK